MDIKGWRYYNHAAIPTTPPHIEPDVEPIIDGRIWNIQGSPLLARWTSEFDCGYETNWWYVVKQAPFEPELLDAKVRKHIRQALKKNMVKKINPAQYSTELCEVFNHACQSYQGYAGPYATPERFLNARKDDDYWAAFNCESEKIIGYMVCRSNADCVETVVAKYDPAYLSQRASDAIHFTILQHYLNEEHYQYVSSGGRSIEHATNVQEYKISTFGFKKAYCKLHVAYNPKFGWLIKTLFPMRRIFGKLKKVSVIGKIYGLLQMEELAREEEQNK